MKLERVCNQYCMCVKSNQPISLKLGHLGDLLAFLIQSPATFHKTQRNYWRQQGNKSTTWLPTVISCNITSLRHWRKHYVSSVKEANLKTIVVSWLQTWQTLNFSSTTVTCLCSICQFASVVVSLLRLWLSDWQLIYLAHQTQYQPAPVSLSTQAAGWLVGDPLSAERCKRTYSYVCDLRAQYISVTIHQINLSGVSFLLPSSFCPCLLMAYSLTDSTWSHLMACLCYCPSMPHHFWH